MAPRGGCQGFVDILEDHPPAKPLDEMAKAVAYLKAIQLGIDKEEVLKTLVLISDRANSLVQACIWQLHERLEATTEWVLCMPRNSGDCRIADALERLHDATLAEG